MVCFFFKFYVIGKYATKATCTKDKNNVYFARLMCCFDHSLHGSAGLL